MILKLRVHGMIGCCLGFDCGVDFLVDCGCEFVNVNCGEFFSFLSFFKSVVMRKGFVGLMSQIFMIYGYGV